MQESGGEGCWYDTLFSVPCGAGKDEKMEAR